MISTPTQSHASSAGKENKQIVPLFLPGTLNVERRRKFEKALPLPEKNDKGTKTSEGGGRGEDRCARLILVFPLFLRE